MFHKDTAPNANVIPAVTTALFLLFFPNQHWSPALHAEQRHSGGPAHPLADFRK